MSTWLSDYEYEQSPTSNFQSPVKLWSVLSTTHNWCLGSESSAGLGDQHPDCKPQVHDQVHTLYTVMFKWWPVEPNYTKEEQK